MKKFPTVFITFITVLTSFSGIVPISLIILSDLTNWYNVEPIAPNATAPNPIGIVRIAIPATANPNTPIELATKPISFICNFSVVFEIVWSDFKNGFNAKDNATNAIEPNIIGADSRPAIDTASPRDNIEPDTSKVCENFNFSVALDNLPNAEPKINNPIDITAIDIEPSIIKADTAGIPNNATAPPNKSVIETITAICLNVTFSVALVILPSAIPNKSKDTLIIAIITEPIKISFLNLLNILNEITFTDTTPSITSEPNSAGIPLDAIEVSAKDANAINPVNTTNEIDAPIALVIRLSFLDIFLAIDVSESTNTDTTIAPNIAGMPIKAVADKNIDVANIFPISMVNLLATFAPFLIFFSFFESF